MGKGGDQQLDQGEHELQEEIMDTKKIHYCGHHQFNLWKIVCFVVFLIGIFFLCYCCS